MKWLKLFFMVCLISLVSVTTFATQQKPYPVVTETKQGVKTIANPDYPRDGRFVAKLTEEMSCGEEGGPEAAMLNKPIELKVDGQGRVYVMDWGDMNIKVYDDQGRFLRPISRQGQGPGEFGTPARFGLLSRGRIGLLDGGQHRVTILTTEGQYVSSFPVEGFHRDIAVDGKDRLFLGKWSAVKEPDKISTEYQEIPYVTSVFRTDETGKELIHLIDFIGESVAMKSAGSGGVVGMVGGGFTVGWTVDLRGHVYGGCNDDYRLSAYGEDGKIEFAFGRKFTPRKNPRFKGGPAQKRTLPVFSTRNIIFDQEGNLWLELTKNEDQKGFLYDVFSPEGIYLKQVQIEQRISQFMMDKIYCLVRPEEGYPSVKRYKLELVPSGK
jgi:hypothetical protein